MTFYLLLALVIALLDVALAPGRSSARRRAFTVVAFGGLGVVGAIRSPSVGGDTQQYYEYFTVIGRLSWGDTQELRYETGYFYLNKVIYTISQDPQVFIAITTLFVVGVLGWFFAKYSANVGLTAILFVFLQGYAFALTALRQSLALSVILLFVPQLVKGRRIRFALGVFLAAQFHYTAWVALTLIIISAWRLGSKSIFVLLTASGVLLSLNRVLMEYVVSGADQYTEYLSMYEGGTGRAGVLLIALVYAAYLIFIAWRCARSDAQYSATIRSNNVIFQASWVVLPAMSLAYGSNVYLRLANYCVPFLIVAVSMGLESVRDIRQRAWWGYVVVGTAIVFFVMITVLRPEWYRITPYASPFF